MEDHDQCLRQAAWQMRFGKPDRPYLSFVERYLVRQAPGQLRADPFDPEALIHTDFYYPRDEVESRIESPDHQVILAPRGAGKTFLFSVLSSRWRKHTLIVPWSRTPAPMLEPELDESVTKDEDHWSTQFRVTFRNAMNRYFSEDAVRDVCFDLGVKYEDLSGNNRSAKVRELIEHCDRHGISPDKVVAACKHANNAFQLSAHLATHSGSVHATYPLSTKSLAEHIFSSYWRQALFYPLTQERHRLLMSLQDHPYWFPMLRQFYQRFAPQCPDLGGEPEFMCRLKATDNTPGGAIGTESSVVLEELIHFVTGEGMPPLSKGDQPYHYESILLLIDDTDRLTAPELGRLMRHLSRLCAMYPALRVKLFADPSRQDEIEEWAAPYYGRLPITVYRLPEWSAADLKHLLALRLLAHTPGEWDEPDVGQLIPSSILSRKARAQFVDILVEGARETYTRRHGLDAPIHALRLARGLIAECARREASQGTAMNESDLRSLVALYWSMTGER